MSEQVKDLIIQIGLIAGIIGTIIASINGYIKTRAEARKLIADAMKVESDAQDVQDKNDIEITRIASAMVNTMRRDIESTKVKMNEMEKFYDRCKNINTKFMILMSDYVHRRSEKTATSKTKSCKACADVDMNFKEQIDTLISEVMNG